MLGNLIAFEVRYHNRQMVTRAAWIAFFALGVLTGFGNFSIVQGFRNAPVTIAYALGLLSLGTPIILALFAGNAILRDHEYRMAPIVFATSTTHFHYVVSRFFGFALSGAFVFLLTTVGLMISHLLPFHEPGTVGTINPAAYFWAFLVIGLPNLLFGSAIIFATAALTRNSAATYISGIFLYILYFVASIWGNSPLLASASLLSPEEVATTALLDPYGLVALLDQIRFWPVTEKNLQFVQLTGTFLINRLMWLGVTMLIFAMTHRLFKFRHGRTNKSAAPESEQEMIVHSGYQPVPATPARLRTQWQTWLSQTKMSFRTLILGLPFYAFMLLWLFFMFVELSEMRDPLDIAIRPMSGILLGRLHGPLLKFGVLVIVFYSVELLWHERRFGMDGILDACPAPNFVFWAAKITAIGGMIGSFLLVTFFASAAFQIFKGQFQLDLNLYGMAFIRVGLSLLMVAILTFTIGSALPNKYASMAVAFFLIVPFSGLVLNHSPGIQHPMLRFAYLPDFLPSSMAGTSYHWPATKWFLCYWLSISGLIGLLGLRLWKRGLGLPFPTAGKGQIVATGLCVLALLFSGGLVYDQINAAQPYQTRQQALNWQANYEKTYAMEAGHPEPSISQVKGSLDLFPKTRTYRLKANLVLENRHQKPIRDLLAGVSKEVNTHTIELEGATIVAQDPQFRQVRYRFDPPIAPGEQRIMHFQAEVTRSPFQPKNPENYILKNATYIEVEKILPFFGFNRNWRIGNPQMRAKYKLPPSLDYPPRENAANQPSDWMTFDLVISTDPRQTAICAGEMIETWHTEGRRYARYASSVPMPMGLGVAASDYQSRTLNLDDMELTYYFPSGQPFHASQILEAAAATLNYGKKHFGPYPYKQLNLAALSAYSDRVGGTAYPGAIFLVENRVILLDPGPGDLDAVSRVVTHETGHQWWGKLLNPAAVAGAPSLTEMLAVYTEMVVRAPLKDKAETYHYLDKTSDLYFFMRTFENRVENPLVSVQFQPYIYYFKAAHVVYMLKEILGENGFNQILSKMLKDFAYPAQPTAKDLLERILADAPSKTHAEIRELLTQVVTYDVGLVSAIGEARPNGTRQITLNITASRTTMDDQGETVTTAMIRPLEIGLYRDGTLVKTAFVQLNQVRQQVQLETQGFVDTVILDPNRHRLEASRDDNSSPIENQTKPAR